MRRRRPTTAGPAVWTGMSSFGCEERQSSPLNGQKRVRLRRTAADLNRDSVVAVRSIRNHYVELILSGADNAGKLCDRRYAADSDRHLTCQGRRVDQLPDRAWRRGGAETGAEKEDCVAGNGGDR